MQRLQRGIAAGVGGVVLGLAAAMVGCTGAQRQSQQREESGLKTLAILYMQF